MMMRAFGKTFVAGSSALLPLSMLIPFGPLHALLRAQTATAGATTLESQTAAAPRMSFEVASVRPSKENAPFKAKCRVGRIGCLSPEWGTLRRECWAQQLYHLRLQDY
jgi:hypothetical protein